MTTPTLNHFLLVHMGRTDELRVEEFGTDSAAAVVAYTEREKEYQDRPDVEVVLLGADSLDTLKRTHGHYFPRATGAAFSLEPDRMSEDVPADVRERPLASPPASVRTTQASAIARRR